jgi:hypothetical protein
MPIGATQATFGPITDVPKLNSENVRLGVQPLLSFAQVCNEDLGTAIGKGAGTQVQLDFLPSIDDTDFSPVAETSVLPNMTVVPSSLIYTVQEYGRQLPLTQRLAHFSPIEIKDKLETLMSQHAARYENGIVGQLMKTGLHKYTYLSAVSGNNYSVNGTPIAATEDINLQNVFDATNELEERNVPYWDGENYICIVRPTTFNNLAASSDVRSILQYSCPESALNREMGVVANTRFFTDNAPGVITAPLVAQSKWFEHFYVGADAVLKEVALPLTAAEEAFNFKRFLSLGYFWLAGYALPNRHSVDSPREHVLHVTSTPS